MSKAKGKAKPARSPFGERLAAAMAEKGIGQRQLARESGVPQSLISDALSGSSRKVAIETAARLAGALGLPTARLLGEDEPLPAAASGVLAPEGWAGASHHDYLPLARLGPSPFNPRRTFDAAELEQLASSIRDNGVLQNLVVRKLPPDLIAGQQYQVIAGERRYRALRLLADRGAWDGAAANVPVRVVAVDDVDAQALALLENLQRADVPPLEEGEAFARLHQLDPMRFSTERLAERIHKSRSYVQQRMALATRLAPEAKRALEEGALNLDRARALLVASAAEQRKLVKRMLKEPSRLRTAEEVRREICGNWIPASRALFDVAASGLAVAEDPETGALYVTDRAAFLAAQRRAAEARVQALAAEWAWAELQEHWFHRTEFAPERSEDRARAGAVLLLHWDGEVEIHCGLVRRERPSESAGAQAKREAAWKRQEKERKAVERFVAQLAGAVAADAALGKRLLALALICDPADTPTAIESTSGRLELARAAAGNAFGELLDRGDGGDVAVLREGADLPSVLELLTEMTDADVDRLLAGVVADSLVVSPYREHGLAFALHLAGRLGVKAPKPLRDKAAALVAEEQDEAVEDAA